jgi:hypothetical protein
MLTAAIVLDLAAGIVGGLIAHCAQRNAASDQVLARRLLGSGVMQPINITALQAVVKAAYACDAHYSRTEFAASGAGFYEQWKWRVVTSFKLLRCGKETG